MTRDELSDLQRAIDEGGDADHFKSTPLGRYILRHATEQALDAVEKLRYLDFTEPDAVVRAHAIQTEMKIAERVLVYIDTAIKEGLDAIHTLEAAEESRTTDVVG